MYKIILTQYPFCISIFRFCYLVLEENDNDSVPAKAKFYLVRD